MIETEGEIVEGDRRLRHRNRDDDRRHPRHDHDCEEVT